VSRLALIEGLGPEAGRPDDAPARVVRWIAEVRAARGRAPRVLGSIEDAARRLRHHNPRLDEGHARRLAGAGTRPVDGGLGWSFDPLHRTRSPSPFLVEVAASFWRRVSCPVTFVRGAESDGDPADLAARMACFPVVAGSHVLSGAGHMVQIDAPEPLAAVLREFLTPVLDPGLGAGPVTRL
jgi:pimeloyl-ACP methyl ester carboxylesterase